MEISQKGIDLIKKFEGCKLSAYRCPAGVWTIGYGHTGADVKAGITITQKKADDLLKQDLITHCNNVSSLVKTQINQNQFDALVSFEYNIGYSQFKASTLLKLLNEGKPEDAAKQFDLWIYANGKPLEGLKRRRKAEYELFIM